MVEDIWEQSGTSHAVATYRVDSNQWGRNKLLAEQHRQQSPRLNITSAQGSRSCEHTLTMPVPPDGSPLNNGKRKRCRHDGCCGTTTYSTDVISCYPQLPTNSDISKLSSLSSSDLRVSGCSDSAAVDDAQRVSQEQLHWVEPSFGKDLPNCPMMGLTEPPPHDMWDIRLPSHECQETTTKSRQGDDSKLPPTKTHPSRARTNYTQFDNRYEDAKGQRRIVRIVGGLTEMEKQQKRHVKQQLRAIEESSLAFTRSTLEEEEMDDTFSKAPVDKRTYC